MAAGTHRWRSFRFSAVSWAQFIALKEIIDFLQYYIPTYFPITFLDYKVIKRPYSSTGVRYWYMLCIFFME